MDLETSHQPWPRSQFEEAMGKLERMGARLETLPPDTALVTKKYLKEYDNSWMKRWNEMERANEERFDRLETRLASFEEAVLRVELKIEHDMKQCLVVRSHKWHIHFLTCHFTSFIYLQYILFHRFSTNNCCRCNAY
jgi:hypothetical protein